MPLAAVDAERLEEADDALHAVEVVQLAVHQRQVNAVQEIERALGAFVLIAARIGRRGQVADHVVADARLHGPGEFRGHFVDGKLQEGVFLVVFAVSLAQVLQLCRAWLTELFLLHMRPTFVMQMLYICDAYNNYTICNNKEKSYKCIAGGGDEVQNPNRPGDDKQMYPVP